MPLVALSDRLIGIDSVHSALVLLGHVRALVGVLVIQEDHAADQRGKEHGQAHAQQRCVAPVLERRPLAERQRDDLDVSVGRYLDRLGRVGDGVDGALPLPELLAGAVEDLQVGVGHLEEGVLEREDAVELEAGDAADEAGVGAHGLVAADVEVARRVEDHVDVGAPGEVEGVGEVLVDADVDGLAAVGARDDDVVVLAVGEVVGRVELEVVEAVVEADAHAAVVVHLEGEVVGELFLVLLVRLDLHDDALFAVGDELGVDDLLLER